MRTHKVDHDGVFMPIDETAEQRRLQDRERSYEWARNDYAPAHDGEPSGRVAIWAFVGGVIVGTLATWYILFLRLP